MSETKENQAGFTLIELIIVIVILGILAAVAVPRIVDLRLEAKTAAAQGIAGGLASASAINYAAYVANTAKGFQVSGTPACSAIANSIMAGGTAQYSASWTFSGSVACGTTAGTTGACSITSSQAPAVSATATIVCTG